MMKISIKIFALVLMCTNLYGQLQRSVLIKDKLYIGVLGDKPYETSVEGYDINQNEPPFETKLGAFVKSPYYDYPFLWAINDSLVYSCSFRHFGHPESISRFFTFGQTTLVKIDRISQFKQDSIASIRLTEKYQDEKERWKVLSKEIEKKIGESNERALQPHIYLFKWYQSKQGGADILKPLKNGNVSTDFLFLNERSFIFYLRDDKQFTIWKYYYPPIGTKSNKKDWEELITFSKDSIGSYQTPLGDSFYFQPKFDYHPSGKKHNYLSIQDSLFFGGHFRVIKQGDNYYCINLKYGRIYLIDESSIEYIGHFDLTLYPSFEKFGQIFIEDKNQEQLIVFSKVVQMRRDLPFPKIKVIEEGNEIRKNFFLLKQISSSK